jgi:hypothetical protein
VDELKLMDKARDCFYQTETAVSGFREAEPPAAQEIQDCSPPCSAFSRALERMPQTRSRPDARSQCWNESAKTLLARHHSIGAACHARARTGEETDWARIVVLHGALAELTPWPVMQLIRALALAMLSGPAVDIELFDKLTSEPALSTNHLLPSVSGNLLGRRMPATMPAPTIRTLTTATRKAS